MTGICITIYNRPDYLLQCLESLSKADLSDCKVLLVDDSSMDDRVKEILRKQDYPVFTMNKRSMVYGALLEGFKHLQDCDTLMVLDSDAIVKPDFVSKTLQLLSKFPTQIVTGFNCVTKDKDGKERHRVIDQGEGWNRKHSIGGIHMAFSRETYLSKVKPELEKCVKKRGQWDMNLCKVMGGAYSTVPSVIQHIGFVSSMGHYHDRPDIAEDFGEVEHVQVNNQGNGKLALIQQFAGIGDVIFCAKLITDICRGYKVVWAVHPDYVEGLNRAYPMFTFIDYTKFHIDYNNRQDIETNGVRMIPLRFTDQLLRVPFRQCMRSKYDFYKTDWTKWREVQPIRNKEKERELMELVGAKGSYTLINTKFRTGMTGGVKIPCEGIEMRQTPGFSLFDWMGVIENATDIHTVSTSIIYLMELVELKCVPHIYIRVPDEKNHDNYNYIMTRHKYNFMENKIPTSGNVVVKVLEKYHDIQLQKNMHPGNEFVCSLERAQHLEKRNRVAILGAADTEYSPPTKAIQTDIKKVRY